MSIVRIDNQEQNVPCAFDFNQLVNVTRDLDLNQYDIINKLHKSDTTLYSSDFEDAGMISICASCARNMHVD